VWIAVRNELANLTLQLYRERVSETASNLGWVLVFVVIFPAALVLPCWLGVKWWAKHPPQSIYAAVPIATAAGKSNHSVSIPVRPAEAFSSRMTAGG